MKKKVLFVIIISFLLTGVVSAAAINGEFKGNPIVKVMSDGKTLAVENTPAVIYNNNTLIPINMLRQLGATVTWDPKDYSVNVTLPKHNSQAPQVPAPTVNLNKIKTLVSALDYYGALNNFGNSFTVMSYHFRSNLDFILDNYQVNESLESANNMLSVTINEYNRLQKQAETFIRSLNSIGIDGSNINLALNGYFKAIDYYKVANNELSVLVNTGKYNVNTFYDNIQFASTEQSNGYNASSSGYSLIYQTIQNQQYETSITNSNTNDVPIVVPTTPSVIKSTIVGDFEGLDNGNIYELDNGQYWKQTDYTYKYSYKYRPDVLIYKDGSSYYIRVDGIDKDAKVEQIK